MWVHPDLMEGQPWTTVTHKKSRGKAKVSPCNVVCASSWEEEIDAASPTDSEEETIVLAAEPNVSLGPIVLEEYDEMVENSLKFTLEPTKQSTKQRMEK